MKISVITPKQFISMMALCFFINYLAGCTSYQTLSRSSVDLKNDDVSSIYLKNGTKINTVFRPRPRIRILEHAVVGTTADLISIALPLDSLMDLHPMMDDGSVPEETNPISRDNFMSGKYKIQAARDRHDKLYVFIPPGASYRNHIFALEVNGSDGRKIVMPMDEVKDLTVMKLNYGDTIVFLLFTILVIGGILVYEATRDMHFGMGGGSMNLDLRLMKK